MQGSSSDSSDLPRLRYPSAPCHASTKGLLHDQGLVAEISHCLKLLPSHQISHVLVHVVLPRSSAGCHMLFVLAETGAVCKISIAFVLQNFGELLRQAAELERARKSGAAEECLEAATQRHPEKFEGWFKLGELLRQSGRVEAAAETFIEGLSSMRSDDHQGIASLSTGLATAYEELGRDKEAADLYEKELPPKSLLP
jgi:tetratricopeptide (TPR) repeat protein